MVPVPKKNNRDEDFDVLRFLTDKGVAYTEGRRGWVALTCPCCDDHGEHGGFNTRPGKTHYYCWKCGWRPIPQVIKALLRLPDMKDAWRVYFEYSGRTHQLEKIAKGEKRQVSYVQVPGGKLLPMHIKYLEGRGYDPARLIDKYGLTAEGPVGDYKFRIIIPVYFRGEVISFVARDVTGEQKTRYKNCPIEESIINPKWVLYNLDNCSGDTVVVVEGIFDCWRMGDGYVASLGTSLTPPQIKLLADFKKVIFLFDNEPEAQKRAKQAAYLLGSMGVEVIVADTEMAKDPGDLSPKEAARVREWIKTL